MLFDVTFSPYENKSSSKYDTRDICIGLVDSFTLLTDELDKIFTMKIGEQFHNQDMRVERIA